MTPPKPAADAREIAPEVAALIAELVPPARRAARRRPGSKIPRRIEQIRALVPVRGATEAELRDALTEVRGLDADLRADSRFVAEAPELLATTSTLDRALRREIRRRRAALAGRSRDGAPAEETAPRPFRVSDGSPAIRALSLGSWAGHREQQDDEDDDDEAAAIVTTPAPVPVGQPLLGSLARDCMEEIAMLGSLRRTPPGHLWLRAAARFEERLLANLDALAALATARDPARRLADLGAQLDRYGYDSALPDPWRRFARALVLASLDAEDAIDAVVSGLADAHASTHAAQIDALALSASPRVGAAVIALSRHPSVDVALAGLEVVRRRQAGSLAEIAEALERPELEVRVAAARCVPGAACASAGASQPDVAAQGAARAVLEPLLGCEDALATAAAEGLAQLGVEAGLDFARARLSAELDRRGLADAELRRLLRLVGVAGGPKDVDLLLRRMREDDGAAARALGWLGHPEAVRPLLSALGASDTATGAASGSAARAEVFGGLARILGGRREERGSGDEPDAARELAREQRDAWQQRAADLGDLKYRAGRAYSPLSTLDDLERDEQPIEDCEDAAFELSVVTGRPWRLDVHGWVGAQLRSTAAAREVITTRRTGRYADGAWPALRAGR